MTTAQKENLLKLHRLAAYYEYTYHMHIATGGTASELAAARSQWAAAGNELASYREYLAMLRVQNDRASARNDYS